MRSIALGLLMDYESMGKYVNLSLSSHITDSLSREERGFLTALLYTTVERKITYDYYIASLSGRSTEKITSRALNILRLGLCQILDMDKIPDFAAVNETVKLAKNQGERSFVNGILRAVVRSKDRLPLPDRAKNEARYLSVLYSFPLATVKRFISYFGNEETVKLLSAFNSQSYTDLTVNTRKTTPSDLLSELQDNGINAALCEHSSISIRVNGGFDPRYVPSFIDGRFFVQDSACAVSVLAAGIKENDTVVDVCACPGGKTFLAAILAGDGGRVYSFDIHDSKLSLVTDGAHRLGLDNVKVKARDAATVNEDMTATADVVICDVPCSGLGVLGKKPDIRYKALEEVENLPDLQYEILSASAEYLKPGGTLIYSTCTLEKNENEGVVDRFLSENTDFISVDFNVSDLKSDGGKLTLYPHVHNTDGFFISKIMKVKA